MAIYIYYTRSFTVTDLIQRRRDLSNMQQIDTSLDNMERASSSTDDYIETSSVLKYYSQDKRYIAKENVGR